MNEPRVRNRGRSRERARRHPLAGWVAFGLALAVLPAPSLAQGQPNIAAEVQSVARGDLKTFYRSRNYVPLWIRDGAIGPEADRFIEIVAQADLDGLDPRDYDPRALREALDDARTGSPRALAKAETRLSRALADYVADVRRPPSVQITYLDAELKPERPTRIAVLNAAARAPSLAEYVDRQGWMSPVYVQLREGLAAYRENWAMLPEVGVTPGSVLRPGSKGERVGMLRMRLGLDYGPAFDKPLTAKLKAFQAAHGLPSDGIAGARTLDALNAGPRHYEELIRLNMERARVLPSPYRRHILVDAASARLWLYENGEAVDSMKVVVGKPATPTPMLAGMMRYAILNPYWNVPPDLVASRIAPKVLGGASLEGMRYEALSGWTRDAHLLPASEIDWQAVANGQEELRVRQLPGGANAMGRVKFMFPNDLGIYLHDTPERALLAKPDRHFSNGCVRLEDAGRLGAWLFGKPLEPASDDPEQIVPLPDPVPVYLTYLTAMPDAKGIAFRDDAYGRDAPSTGRYASVE